MNIFVINQYAGNKGDRAVAFFVMRELRRNGMHNVALSTHDRSFWTNYKEIFGTQVRLVPWAESSEKPHGLISWLMARGRRTRARYALNLSETLFLRGINSSSICRFLCNREFCRELQRADIVISTGGHHVTTRFLPEAQAWQYLDMSMALICKKPLALWSQTIGPLDFKEEKSRVFVKKLLNSCSAIFVRETDSLQVLRKLGLKLDNVNETYDSVFGLNDELVDCLPPSRRQPNVGIAVYNAEGRTVECYNEYVLQMSRIVDGIVAMGLTPVFFPHEMKGATIDDRSCIRDIINSAKKGYVCKVLEDDLDPTGHLHEVTACRLFVGHKTHSIVFALTVGTPLLALAYHSKSVKFMEQYELEEFCIDDSKLCAESALELLDKLHQNADAISEKQLLKSREIGKKVRDDFKTMLEKLLTNSKSDRAHN